MPREGFIRFLVGTEGLKCSGEVMNRWLDEHPPYRQEHPDLVIGPLRADQYRYLKTVTFFVNPDQLSLLATAAEYCNASRENPRVVLRFGSGCSQMAASLGDLEAPLALVGGTDIAMRQHLPPDMLAFTVTRAMFEQLCSLGPDSFLYKPFWRNLQKARGLGGPTES